MFIYTLSDPCTNEIRYVGKTKNIDNRYKRHLQKCYLENYSKNTYKSNWIKSLIEKGYKPLIEILDYGNENNINELEIYWIYQLRSWGYKLTNLSEGGEVGVNWKGRSHSILSKEKMKISHHVRSIIEYDLDGNQINEYISLSEASKLTKCHISLISNCCKKKSYYTVNNKTFRYKGDRFDYIKYNKNSQINSRKVCQYDLNGNLIEIYDSIRKAELITSCKKPNITRCCNKKNTTSGKIINVKGYIWRYFDETKGNTI